MKTFWIDTTQNLNVSYNLLFNKLLEASENNTYVKSNNPFNVFLSVLKNLINQQKSILLDASFSEDELNSLGISNEIIAQGKYKQKDLKNRFESFDDVFKFLELIKNDVHIEIFTSGTTGRPKKVTQSLQNIIRSVKQSEKHQSNVWAFAYNPTHFAGLQVFFQAFMNCNTMIYVFGKDFQEVNQEIVKGSITHLSCTPTFMKMLLPCVNEANHTITNLTFGGEQFDENVEKEITEKFPNAKIRNVYASTEAGSLLATDGKSFKIPKRFKDLIKISENNELLIHQNLLGNSKSFNLHENWYCSGDIVEFINDDHFIFKNRKSDLINVGGYKVNSTEVEEIIKKIKAVKDALVIGRKNSLMGNIVTAQVIIEPGLDIDKKEVKKQIQEITSKNLQEWKIPRLIKFVDEFQLTRTGKLKK